MNKTLIFIPTYNERENVRPLCEKIVALGLDADILFMDDASPDGTGAELDKLAAEHERLKVIHRSGKLGLGTAHQQGIEYAYQQGYRTLITMDCDFTHDPADIPLLVEKSAGAEITVGSRFLKRDSLEEWSPLRKALTRFGHFLTRRMLGIDVDATGAFRVYDLTRVPRGLFGIVQSRGYSFFFESLFVARQNGLTLREVPIRLPARTYGHSKMSLREVFRSVRRLLGLYFASVVKPGQFRLGRAAPANPALVDPQGWDSYWKKKETTGAGAYDLVAWAYRNTVIKANLNATIRREFPPGARLLHAGCGSGQVDTDLHRDYKISAVDISVPALEIYLRENPGTFEVKHASIFELPYPDGTFDGVYNLGVLEHFTAEELPRVLAELRRVTKPGGKLVVFWPHKYATSVMVLNSIHWVMKSILKSEERLHPPEYSLVRSRAEARDKFGAAGFDLRSYSFGPRDFFVQAIVVGQRR